MFLRKLSVKTCLAIIRMECLVIGDSGIHSTISILAQLILALLPKYPLNPVWRSPVEKGNWSAITTG